MAGIRSAKAAGMEVLAVATTYPIEKLSEADLVLPTLDGAALHRLTDHLSSKWLHKPSHSRLYT
jgi:beta-phosphoglucomutase-like phosphatase (HAD superfamily)